MECNPNSTVELVVSKSSVDPESHTTSQQATLIIPTQNDSRRDSGQLQGKPKFKKGKLTLNYLQLIAHGEDDFYHKECCLKLLCNNRKIVQCLSLTHHSPKRSALLVLLETVLYAILIVIQHIFLIESEYCTCII